MVNLLHDLQVDELAILRELQFQHARGLSPKVELDCDASFASHGRENDERV
ncbi:MAG TPA: hypothetical protein VF331_14925 [Polyangiales bacterium]